MVLYQKDVTLHFYTLPENFKKKEVQIFYPMLKAVNFISLLSAKTHQNTKHGL